MISVVKNKLTVLQFSNLNLFSEIFHFSTTRIGGCSSDNYSSLNLGFNSGDLPENVIQNRGALCDALEINPAHLVFPMQTHTSNVKTISSRFLNWIKRAEGSFSMKLMQLLQILRKFA